MSEIKAQKIFFSYARADAEEFALKLATALRNDGANVWIDQLDIKGGENYNEAIELALQSSTHVLYIVSEKSVNSKYVLNEVFYALDENKIVVPVILYNAPVRLRLRELQQINFINNFENGYNRLLQTLNLSKLIQKDPTQSVNLPGTEKTLSDVNNSQKSNFDQRLNKIAIKRILLSKPVVAISAIVALLIVWFIASPNKNTDERTTANIVSSPDTVKINKPLNNPQPTENLPPKPINAEAYFKEAQRLSGLLRYPEAIKRFSQAIKLRPTYFEAYYGRAQTKEKIGDLESAIKDYDTAVRIKPDDDTYAFRGYAKSRLYDYKGAIADYSKAIKLNQTNSYAYYMRGRAKDDLNDIKGAFADFSRWVELDPTANGFYTRAALRKKLGDLNGVCEDLKKCCEISKHSFYCGEYRKQCK
jgi:tetratricopeptide (TPR) repeat protein